MKNVIKKIVAKVKLMAERMRELLVKVLTEVNLRKAEATEGVVVSVNGVVTVAEEKETPAVFNNLQEAMASLATERGRAFDPYQSAKKSGTSTKKRKTKTLRKRNKNSK